MIRRVLGALALGALALGAYLATDRALRPAPSPWSFIPTPAVLA